MSEISELMERTKQIVQDLEEEWEGVEEEFNLDDDSTEGMRLFCANIAGSLDEVLDILKDNPEV